MTLFGNEALARPRSGFQDFPISTKITFGENGVLASTASEVPLIFATQERMIAIGANPSYSTI